MIRMKTFQIWKNMFSGEIIINFRKFSTVNSSYFFKLPAFKLLKSESEEFSSPHCSSFILFSLFLNSLSRAFLFSSSGDGLSYPKLFVLCVLSRQILYLLFLEVGGTIPYILLSFSYRLAPNLTSLHLSMCLARG